MGQEAPGPQPKRLLTTEATEEHREELKVTAENAKEHRGSSLGTHSAHSSGLRFQPLLAVFIGEHRR